MMNAQKISNDVPQPEPPPTVLVVDDQVLIRLAIADYLRDCGYRVIEAGNGDEALSVLNAADVEIDVLFSDVQMPGRVDGFGLSQWVRRERPGIRIVLTSGVARACDAAEGLCEDGPLMEKPYSAADVESRVRSLLSRRR
jgi:CheY-like chemotaxis protein